MHDPASQCCGKAASPASRPDMPDMPDMPALPVADQALAGTRHLLLQIDNMDCPMEERLIRNRLTPMAGIVRLDFNLLLRQLNVVHALEDAEPIHAALRALDMQATAIEPATANSGIAARKAVGVARSRRQWWQIGIGAGAALLAEILAWSSGEESSWPVIGLALLAIAISGTGTYRKGWIALKNRDLNINALMAIAVTGALLIGQWPEAAMVMVLFALAEMIEAHSLERARHAIDGLMALAPPQATVLQPDGSWHAVDITGVGPGALARVAPGERVALDGVLTVGQSTLDQAPITGESMPVSKTVGDAVFAGSINQTGSFEYRVTASANDSTLARIIHAVENAQAGRAPTQRFVDRFARVYTPIVVLLALAVAVIAPLAFGMAWSAAAYQALVLLVIACPCALVVSTPVTIVSAMAAAAKGGILIKGGVYLEQGKNLRVLALDKTGTLTAGRPVVTDTVSVASAPDATPALRLAAALALRSDHPVSRALAAHWKLQAGAEAIPDVSGFAALPGLGVQGEIDGRRYSLGNHRLVEQLGLCNGATEAALRQIEAEGKSAVVLCDAAGPQAVFGVADTVRADSRQAIAELQALGLHTVMLTGDNTLTAEAIAKQVGIDDARGDLLPDDKLAAIHELLQRYGGVGMVGDGINDAPALAQASIGFAMGAAGSDTALETADVALMDDDLRKLAGFIRLSRKTAAVLKQNIALALGIKAVFLLLALSGMATLWMAVFADMGASLLVVFNGMRLLRGMRHSPSPAA
jgi:Zn2+/Cd2+-exporting ATPase